jgi:hypothetical protein
MVARGWNFFYNFFLFFWFIIDFWEMCVAAFTAAAAVKGKQYIPKIYDEPYFFLFFRRCLNHRLRGLRRTGRIFLFAFVAELRGTNYEVRITRYELRGTRAEGAQARGIAADVLPFPEGNGGTGADSPTRGASKRGRKPEVSARRSGSPKKPMLVKEENEIKKDEIKKQLEIKIFRAVFYCA